MSNVFEYTISFVPAYFNSAARANIPARWKAEIISSLPEGLAIYTDGCASKEEAIADLILQAKKFGLSGKLRKIA